MPNGFDNIGATCYWNSIIQSLLSCEIFNTTMKRLKPHKNAFINTYNEMLDVDDSQKSPYAGRLWHNMIEILRKEKKYTSFGNGQEDSHEGMIMLLECMDGVEEIQELFRSKKKVELICFDCKKPIKLYTEKNGIKEETQRKNEIDNVVFLEPDYLSIREKFIEYVKNKKDVNVHLLTNYTFQRAIKTQYDIIEMKCTTPNCTATQILKQTSLLTLPSILVVCFKKYFQKNLLMFPPSLEYITVDKRVEKFNLVSQIEHSGGMGGGHYWSISKRDNIWYQFNDSHYRPDSQSPTDLTYMIFYQR